MSSDNESPPSRPRPSPWGEPVLGGGPDPRRSSTENERIFNAPLLALLLAASMPALYYMQSRQPDSVGLLYAYALTPRDMVNGAWIGLFTHMLLHGGWAHAMMNAVGALAFGSPVARLMTGARGVVGFLSFYIACGVIAGGGYALMHIDSGAPLVGASGAVFGLIGAATRLMGGHGRLLPLFDRRVVMGALAWIGVNLVLGVLGFAPGAEGGRIAWEAHIIGLLAGLILIGPWARLFAPSRDRDRPSV